MGRDPNSTQPAYGASQRLAQRISIRGHDPDNDERHFPRHRNVDFRNHVAPRHRNRVDQPRTGLSGGPRAARGRRCRDRALRNGPHQYPPMLGVPALRQAVAENARRFLGLEVDWEREVLVTSGATEALGGRLLRTAQSRRRGDSVRAGLRQLSGPILRRGGAMPVPVRLTPPKWELPRDGLLSRDHAKRTRAIVINTPMNPIGKIFGDDELRFHRRLSASSTISIAIADEVYEHLIFDGRRHKTLFALPDRPRPGGAHRLGRQDLLGDGLEGRICHGRRQADGADRAPISS